MLAPLCFATSLPCPLDFCGFKDTHEIISTLKKRTSLLDQLSYEIALIELCNLISHPTTQEINSKHKHITHTTRQRKHIDST